MNIEIKDRKKNVLLSREEISAKISFDAQTPRKDDILKAFADYLKVEPEKIVIKAAHTSFGEKSAFVTAYIYDSAEKKQQIEPKKKEKKAPAAKAAKEEGKPAAKAKK